MNKKYTARTTLQKAILLLLENLEELDLSDRKDEEFICGERIAYVECLEILQQWSGAEKSGLDFDIEARFPV